jgi:hypothetical protein
MLAPYQQRLLNEYDELFIKTTGLGMFFGSREFLNLDSAEQDRLNRQWKIMQKYGEVLAERIAAFK